MNQPYSPPLTNPPARKRAKWPWIVGGIVALLIVGSALGSTQSGTGNGTDTGGTTDSGISQGFGSQDASADVSLGKCHDGGQYAREVVECSLLITNHSDGTSDYYIEAQASMGGTVLGGLINASVSSVPAGGEAQAKLQGLADGKWDTIKVIQVQRTASV